MLTMRKLTAATLGAALAVAGLGACAHVDSNPDDEIVVRDGRVRSDADEEIILRGDLDTDDDFELEFDD